MKDKQMRSILIAYLKTTAKEIRIYQEKSIGSSICDVMAVTNILTGYEIKSDSDNFQRLEKQITAYDRFFDENYIVVGKQRLASAESRIPKNWGILCIDDSSITVERKANRNTLVSRRAQLTVLWKLELKNLLVKNNLPLSPLKPKDYLVNAIDEMVAPNILGPQIAEELLRRDYSVFGAEDLTDYSLNEDALPEAEIVDALSERDLNDFTLDQWIELYRRAKQVREVKDEAVRVLPVERKPHAIPYTEIEVGIGAPWIDKRIIAEFIIEVFKPRNYKSSMIDIVHEPITGCWTIYCKDRLAERMPAEESVRFGIAGYSALHILEATLNLREIKLFDNGTTFNEKNTIAAVEKQRSIKQAFRDWLWLDEDRRWQVEEAYNSLFCVYGKKTYDGSKIPFPEMSDECTLYDYQKDAVKRIMDDPNTLLAFDVGAGKTYIMIAAAMKLRQEGSSRKNLFVVPNNIVGQWELIFTTMYPKAKVLAIEPKSFKPELRQKVLHQMRDGDYDGIIIAYSCFEQIPLSANEIMSNLETRISRIDGAIQQIKNSSRICEISNLLKKEKDRIKKETYEFIASIGEPALNGLTFEELDITGLFLDEAHNYKNLPIRTRMKNINGINTKGSRKCLDMLHKIRCVQSKGRGVVLATGTPLCNSISDVYTLQVYLQHNELMKSNLDLFDNWAKTFAEPEQVFEIDVTANKYRMVRRFSRFFNLAELSKMFSQIAVFHAMDDAENMPKLDGYRDISIKPYRELSDYMKELVERTEKIRSKNVHPGKDNMLKVSTDGRKAALDLRLVARAQPGGVNSKICRCIETAVEIYNEFPSSTQLIFCDYSTPKGGDAFSVYRELKEGLCICGVKPQEIAFIHSYGTEMRKLELFARFNKGDVRFIIGSTFKLGIGANVQTKLKAIHHIDVPWRPADMVQREGRILRRGNENERVFIFRYIAEGSFDAYSWQLLERKQRFISQFLSGSSYQRSASDLEDNVLTYAEVKALALSDPMMKALAEKENELKNIRILHSQKLSEIRMKTDELAELEKRLPEVLHKKQAAAMNAEYSASLSEDQLKEALNKLALNEAWIRYAEFYAPEMPLELLGFTVNMPDMQDEKKPRISVERLGIKYRLEVGHSASGNARRVINLIKKMGDYAIEAENKYQRDLLRKEELAKLLKNSKSEYIEKIKSCEEEIEVMQKKIRE